MSMVKKWFWIVYLVLLAVMVAVATLLPKCSGRLKVLFTLLSVALPLAALHGMPWPRAGKTLVRQPSSRWTKTRSVTSRAC